MMYIVAVLETDCLAGGGFNQALNAILQMQRICNGRFKYSVTTNIKENIEYLAKLGIEAQRHRYGLLDRLLRVLKKTLLGARFAARIGLTGGFEQNLKRQNVDLVYFVMPSATPSILQDLNYIFTIWDLCHRDFPEFPEVRNSGVFHERESIYRDYVGPACLVITESRQGTEAAVRRYGLDTERMLAMPLSEAPFLMNDHATCSEEVARIYDLEPGYYFYPAQLWPHKNHARILNALDKLRNAGIVKQLVLAGGDKGNGEYIRKKIAEKKLDNQVRILGFVPPEHLRGLYENCIAVLMPTYFGPTNIPPLEAWSIGRPLVYSSHLVDQVGDAALLVNPDDEASLSKAMEEVLDSSVATSLIEKGKVRLKTIKKQRDEAESELMQKIIIFNQRRKCWE